MCLGTVHYHLGGEKIKTLKCLPDSSACVLPAQGSCQLYISSIIWDHMWKFWSVTFLFLFFRPKRLVSLPNCLIKKARVASMACRQNGDEREGGRTWWFGEDRVGTSLLLALSPLSLSWTFLVLFTNDTLHHSPPKTFWSLWLSQSACPIPKHSSVDRDLNSTLLEDTGSSASKIIFLFFFCLWHYFLALRAFPIFPQQICKLIFIERSTTSQHGFTEKQPRGTNPISPSQNGNQAVNWKDAKM